MWEMEIKKGVQKGEGKKRKYVRREGGGREGRKEGKKGKGIRGGRKNNT